MQEQDNERRAQLVAAGEALVNWLYARRATWPTAQAADAVSDALSVVPDLTTTGLDPEAAFAATAVAATAAASGVTAEPAPARIKRARPAISIRLPTAALHSLASLGSLAGRRLLAALASLAGLRSLAGPALRWSLRAAALAAAVAVMIGAAGVAQPYWAEREAYWSALTARLKPAPVAEAPAPVVNPDAGQVVVQSEPPGARVLIDGRERGTTPLTIDDLSLGRHTVVIESEQGSVRRTVTVTPDRPAVVSEAIFAGFLRVFAPFELQIAAGSRAIRLDDRGQTMLPPGVYELQIENRTLGYREARRVEINPGETTTLSLVPPPSRLAVVSSEPASVTIDGEPAGDTPVTDHPIALGTRVIVVRSSGGEERRFTRTVTPAPVQIEVNFSQP